MIHFLAFPLYVLVVLCGLPLLIPFMLAHLYGWVFGGHIASECILIAFSVQPLRRLVELGRSGPDPF